MSGEPKPDRLMSLDVFRGMTIASMTLVNNPGTWSAIYPPLEHAEWHGWTFTDTVFPFFLWIAGVAMTLSFSKRVERGDDRWRLFLHTTRRAAILFAIGIFLAGFPYFPWYRIRIPGVLQRIAVCYLITAGIFLATRLRGQIVACVFFLASYWALMTLYPVPGVGPGHLEKEANFARYIDGIVLTGHMWSQTKVWDPEGIVSTLPAISTCLFGVFMGYLLRLNREPAERAVWMFVMGNALMAAGSALSTWMPINKNLWTSTYSIFMAGLASVVFAFCYWFVDVQGWRKWTQPLAIYGMNAIAVFVLSGLLARSMGLIKVGSKSLQALIFETAFLPLASPINASLLYAIAYVLLFYGVAYGMFRKGWFVRI